MFSANENIALRQHKRRIVELVEETIPEDALDLGTMVMVMQVSCKAPGCVPLETVVCIVFPNSSTQLIPGLAESQNGGTYKTKILMPMAEVRKNDVLEALPPAFQGGTLSVERLCLQARDVMLAQITQLMNRKEDQKMMAQYLQQCLNQYLQRNCEAPEYGQPFPEELSQTTDQPAIMETLGQATQNITLGQRIHKDDTKPSTTASITTTNTTSTTSNRTPHTPSSNDWRRQQSMQRQLTASSSSQSILNRIVEREHRPGMRRPGCPCCDTDSTSNVLDQMMML